MRKTVLSTLVVALLLGMFSSGPALAGSSSDLRPVAVVSLAGYDELLANVEMAGKLSGRPALARGLEGMLAVVTHGKGLAGLDKKRPWGVVVQTDGSKLGGYAFLPVDDLDEFEKVLEPYIKKVEDLGDGVRKVQGNGPRQAIYIKQKKGGWLFVCDKPEGLAATPNDPTKVLDGLHRQYDAAVRLNVSNLPAQQRGELIAKIRQQAEKDLKRRPGEDEKGYAIRKIVAARVLAVVATIVEDLEVVTLGWSLDDYAQKVFLEMAATAKQGTKTADVLSGLAQAKTNFAGFRLPGAVLTGNLAATCPHAADADLDELFEALRAKAFEGIDAREQSDQKAKGAKEIVDGLLEVIQATVASGRSDAAVSVVLSPKAATFVAGRYVANGRKLEEMLKRFVEAARREDPDLVDEVLTMDAGEVKGVRLHALSIPVPDDADNREKVVQLVGERLEVVVGIGKEGLYLAAGRDAMGTLKKAIAQSAARAQEKTSPMELSVALGEVAKFLAEAGREGQQQRALKALAALEDARGKDHLKLVAVPAERGVKLRLELEQGALRMIQAMPGAPGRAAKDER